MASKIQRTAEARRCVQPPGPLRSRSANVRESSGIETTPGTISTIAFIRYHRIDNRRNRTDCRAVSLAPETEGWLGFKADVVNKAPAKHGLVLVLSHALRGL